MPDSRSDCARSWERSLARTWYVWRTCCGRVADRRPVPTRAHAPGDRRGRARGAERAVARVARALQCLSGSAQARRVVGRGHPAAARRRVSQGRRGGDGREPAGPRGGRHSCGRQRQRRDSPHGGPQAVAHPGIPRAIGAVFERQIRRLDATSRAALDLAAVLGRRLADLPLYTVVGLSPAGAGEALTRLLEEGFLREVHGTLEFRNELIRAQAYYAVAGPARQHLHREVGGLLAERKFGDARSYNLEVAWHFLRGRDACRALSYALEGAGAAMQVGAPYESEQVLSALLHQPCGKEQSERIQLLLARALVDQSKADDALPILGELVANAELTSRT